MWIESHQEISRHPKTKRFARKLKISIPTAVGHLHMMWHWCLDYAKDGDLSRHDEAEIADAAMYEGPPQNFKAALIEAGFLDLDSSGLRVHDWFQYGGRLLIMRQANAAKQKKWRENHGQKDDKKPNLKIA